MEEMIINLAVFSSTVYLILLSMAILSAVMLFKKTPKFAAGLIIAMTGALGSVILTNFVTTQNARLASAILITATMSIWAILWVIEVAYHERD